LILELQSGNTSVLKIELFNNIETTEEIVWQ